MKIKKSSVDYTTTNDPLNISVGFGINEHCISNFNLDNEFKYANDNGSMVYLGSGNDLKGHTVKVVSLVNNIKGEKITKEGDPNKGKYRVHINILLSDGKKTLKVLPYEEFVDNETEMVQFVNSIKIK